MYEMYNLTYKNITYYVYFYYSRCVYNDKGPSYILIICIILYYILIRIDFCDFLYHYVEIISENVDNTLLNINPMDISNLLNPAPSDTLTANHQGSRHGGGNGDGNDNGNVPDTGNTNPQDDYCRACGLSDSKRSEIIARLKHVKTAQPRPFRDRSLIRCGFEDDEKVLIKNHIRHQGQPLNLKREIHEKVQRASATINFQSLNETPASRILEYFRRHF
jgi:hypothetical protein